MPFQLQPILTGKLLVLKPLQTSDFEVLYAAAADPCIWEQHPASDRYKREVFEENYFKTAIESGGAFLITDLATGAVVGSTRYYGYNQAESEIEIGWTFLTRSHWGGTYNHEMKRMMLDHAFQFVENVVFAIGINNIRSQRAVEKIGGQPVEVHPRKNETSVVYRITQKTRLI
ncbi:MAG: N-acetyltransferase [Candidatus Kapaibacterium sp.]|nr:MAG: N-acetyltransferase [Candidatus Kapabacteria bacterium]